MQKVASDFISLTSIKLQVFNGFHEKSLTNNRPSFPDASLESIKLLAYAILERAYLDASGAPLEGCWTLSQKSAVKQDAIRWLKYWHDIDANTPGSLPWCCEVLEIDSLETSEKLLSLIKQKSQIKRSALPNSSRSIYMSLDPSENYILHYNKK